MHAGPTICLRTRSRSRLQISNSHVGWEFFEVVG